MSLTEQATRPKAISNKYRGKCTNCNTRVEADAGFVMKNDSGKWICYCSDCLPVKRGDPVAGMARKLTIAGEIIMPFDRDALPLLRSIGRWDATQKVWLADLSEAARPRLLEVTEQLGIDVDPGIGKIAMSERAKSAKRHGAYPFQVEGVDWLSKSDHALLGDEMGAGKSMQALFALPQGVACRAIVVAPAAVKYHWQDECARWRIDLKPTVLEGRGSLRMPQPGEVLICNYELLPKYLEPQREEGSFDVYFNDLPGEWIKDAHKVTTIIDEVHKAKNYKTNRSKRVQGLAHLCGKTWGLTGTPLMNKPPDLWGVLSSLRLQRKVFGSYNNFKKLFGGGSNRWGGMNWGSIDPSVPELMRQVMLRRRREDVLPDLPRKTITTMVVNGLDVELRQKMDDLWDVWGSTLEGQEALPPFYEFSSIRAELAASRIPVMHEIIDDHEEQDTPLLVFSAHRAPVLSAGEREGWEAITGDTPSERRQEIVQSFQRGDLKGVALTIQAGGVGLTLTHAHRAMFVDLDWVPANNWQAQDRICRIGQTADKCEYIHLVSNHVLDRHVEKLLVKKIKMVQEAIEGASALQVNPVEHESEEQYQARMARVEERRQEIIAEQAAAEEAMLQKIAREKIEDKGASHIISAQEKGLLLELTAERIDVVKDAFSYMLSVCDGAKTRDDCGFNKPDSCMAHWCVTSTLEQTGEVALAYALMVKYPRQLRDKYPLLFTDKEN